MFILLVLEAKRDVKYVTKKNRKHFKECGQCHKQYCQHCFIKSNEKYLSCPFCRYTFKTHILNNLHQIDEDESKHFVFNIEI